MSLAPAPMGRKNKNRKGEEKGGEKSFSQHNKPEASTNKNHDRYNAQSGRNSEKA